MDALLFRGKQILQYPTKVEAAPSDAFLLQSGGLGGPYQVVNSVGLVQGAFTQGGIEWSVSGSFAIDQNLSVAGDITTGGALDVGGDINGAGNAIFNGNGYFGGTLDVIGNTSLGSLTVNGPGTINGDLFITGDFGADGSGTFLGSLTLVGELTVGQNAQIDGDLMVNGTLGVANGAWGLVWFSPSTNMPPVTSGTPGVFWWQNDEQELMLWDGTNWHDLAGRHMELERWDQTDLLWDDEGWEHRWWPQGARQASEVAPAATATR